MKCEFGAVVEWGRTEVFEKNLPSCHFFPPQFAHQKQKADHEESFLLAYSARSMSSEVL
jgi:hypothetical protein